MKLRRHTWEPVPSFKTPGLRECFRRCAKCGLRQHRLPGLGILRWKRSHRDVQPEGKHV